MFAIANERKSLWQWDLNQQLTVDGDCTEVHYLDRGTPSTLTVEVRDGKADIPNILLQRAGRLVVYAYIIDEQDHHTKVCETFGIALRPKPAEYVYTETEVKTWGDLQAQIGDLADLATDEKSNLVAAINEAARSSGGGGGTDSEVPTPSPSDVGKVLGVVQTGENQAGYDFVHSITLPDVIDLGISGATVGQTIKVHGVDDFDGRPSSWEAVDMPSGGSEKLETFDGMQLLASGTIASGTAAGTITDTGVTYGAFKQWHRVIFLRRCISEQGNFSSGYGAGNDAGFRNGLANLSVTLEHIDGYLWKYWCHATNTAPYAVPTTKIQELTGTLWTPAITTTTNCDIGEGYIDIRINNKNSFSDDNTFVIKNWAALTADVSWYIYGLTKEIQT